MRLLNVFNDARCYLHSLGQCAHADAKEEA
jgi:hypothetical protein